MLTARAAVFPAVPRRKVRWKALAVGLLMGGFCLQAALAPSAAGAQDADSVDLEGSWNFEISRGGTKSRLGVVSINQEGREIQASWSELSTDMAETFGYAPGDTAFEGEVREGTLAGRIRLHYPVENREPCPDSWQTWDRLEIALPIQPQRLQGRFRNSAISQRDCTVEKRGWLFFTLARLKAPSEADGAAQSAASAILAEAAFDADNDGWLEVDGTENPAPAPFIQTGGNPGGYIGATPLRSFDTAWDAPIQFLGDRGSARGGELLLDAKLDRDAAEHRLRIVLEGEKDSIEQTRTLKAESDWQTISLRLTADGSWILSESGQPAGEADIGGVLSSLNRLRIAGTGIEGLDNIVLSAVPIDPGESTPSPTPARVRIGLLDRSAVAGKAMNLDIGLVNDVNQRVPADKDYSVDLSAEGAEVRPARVAIPRGSAGAGARVYGETPGAIAIRGTAPDSGLESGSATGFICAQGEIARINFGATAQEVPVGESIHVTLDLVNETGTLVTDDGRRKRLNVVIEGVGRVTQPAPGWIDQGRCTTELELVSDRPGESPVSVSLGRIGPEQRSFRFFLELTPLVFLAVAVGGLLGGFARAVSIWKRARNWKALRWAMELSAAIISGLAVFLVYHFGVIATLPQLSGGLGLAVLLSLVGGYLGPTAIDRIAERMLPAGKGKA